MKGKQKRMLSLFLVIAISLFTWGCGEKAKEAGNMNVVEAAEPEIPLQPEVDAPKQVKPTELSSEQKDLIDGFQYEIPCEANWYAVDVPGGMEVQYDLNSDGKAETLYYATKTAGENGRMVNSMLINGIEYKAIFEGGNVREEYFGIVDLSEGDGYLEVAIYDRGEGADLTTAFYRYDNGELKKLGTVQGFVDSEAVGRGETHLDGKDNIYGMFSLNVLKAWEAPGQWRLNGEGSIVKVEEPLYYPQIPEAAKGENYIHINKSLLLYTEQDTASEHFRAAPSQGKVSFMATDDKEWILITVADGMSGWMHWKDGRQVETEPGIYEDAAEVLANLVLYDEG